MAQPILQGTDLALWSDPVTSRVAIPHLVAAPRDEKWSGTMVTFDGDQYGTPFRGTAESLTWQMSCLYGHLEQAELLALLDLLRTAARAPDSRLQLRTHIGAIPGLDAVQAIAVFGVQVEPRPGMIHAVTFTAEAAHAVEGV